MQNPNATALSEHIYAQAGSYWWSWAERLAGYDQPAAAATTLARVLRTSDDAASSDILALEALEREFGWICWHDGDQSYARRPSTPAHDHDARGDDPADLREAIILALRTDPNVPLFIQQGRPRQPNGQYPRLPFHTEPGSDAGPAPTDPSEDVTRWR